MIIGFLKDLFWQEWMRKMDPDDRVAVLEQARLDPYDYIYLAC